MVICFRSYRYICVPREWSKLSRSYCFSWGKLHREGRRGCHLQVVIIKRRIYNIFTCWQKQLHRSIFDPREVQRMPLKDRRGSSAIAMVQQWQMTQSFLLYIPTANILILYLPIAIFLLIFDESPEEIKPEKPDLLNTIEIEFVPTVNLKKSMEDNWIYYHRLCCGIFRTARNSKGCLNEKVAWKYRKVWLKKF